MKTDARVRYTRMIIQNTFLKLLKEKPISKITVKEICEIAEINRTTFYKHYHDPYDLLEKLEEEAISGLLSTMEESRSEHILLSILRTIYKNHNLFDHLISAGDDKSFSYRLAVRCFEKIKDITLQDAGNQPPALTSGLYFSYLAGGVSGIIEYWIQSGMKETPEDIADAINKLNGAALKNI